MLNTRAKSRVYSPKKADKFANIINKAKRITSMSQDNIIVGTYDLPKEELLNQSNYEYTDTNILLSESKSTQGPHISEAMVEYINSPIFDPVLEEKKLKNLQQFFCEKYLLVNECIDESHSKKQIQERVNNIVKRMVTKLTRNDRSNSPSESPIKLNPVKKSHKKFQSEWEQQMDCIDDNINYILDEVSFDEKKKKEFEMRKLIEINKMSKPTNTKRNTSVNAESKIKHLIQQDPTFHNFRYVKTPVKPVKEYISQILNIGRSNSSYLKSTTISNISSPVKSKIPSIKKEIKKNYSEFEIKTITNESSDIEKFHDFTNTFVKESSFMARDLRSAFKQRTASKSSIM